MQKITINQYYYALNAFRVLEGTDTERCKNKKEIEAFKDKISGGVINVSETNIYLTEENFIQNIGTLFDDAPEYFGKMLYIYMSKGYDRVKISLLTFLECMYPLINPDNRFIYNKIAYSILDIDRDGELNIQNLIQL